MAAFTKDAQLKVKSYRKEKSPALQRHFGMAARTRPATACAASCRWASSARRRSPPTFPPDIGAQFSKDDFTDVLIFRSVQKHLGLRLAVAHVTVRAEIADEAVAADLGVAIGDPILTVEMLYQSADQRNIEFSVARHPADLFSITYDAPNDL